MGRLRSEDGFTLTELLVAAAAGIAVMLGALALTDTSVTIGARNTDRVDAVSRGRTAMQGLIARIASPVCLPFNGASPLALINAQDSELTFYSSFAPASSDRLVVQRRRLVYRSATNDVLEQTWAATTTGSTLPDRNKASDFVASPTSRVIADGIRPTGSTPIFTYRKFDSTGAPKTQVTTPITTSGALNSVVQVEVNFTSVARQARNNTPFTSRAYFRLSNPGNDIENNVYVPGADGVCQ